MHKARAFFYVCAGLFLLALSYHVGARSAGAQAGNHVVTGSFDYDIDPCAVDASGQLWVLDKPSHQTHGPYSLPAAGTIVEVTARYSANPDFVGSVLYENGDAYFHDPAVGWTFVGNVLGGGPVPAARESFGALKTRYRQQGAAQPAPQDR